jgi:hypothetical protein
MAAGSVQPKARAQLWTGSAWIDAPGDATNGAKVQGTVAVSNFPATQPVSGTFYQATQPVSLASAPTTPVTGTFWQATQPVSLATNTPDVTDRSARLLGHVTVDSAPTTAVTAASLPLPTGAATETTVAAVSGGVGATSDAEASSGNGSLVAVLKRLRTLLNGGLPAALSSNGGLKVEQVVAGPTQPVSGTVTANAGSGPFPVSDNSGSLTVDAPVGTPLFTRLSDGTSALTTSSGRLAVDASGAAVPITDNGGSLTVDGTVTANAGSGPFPVSDNAGSLTVDAAAGTFGATVTPLADAVSTGSFTANGDSLVAAVTAGMTEWGAYVQGTYATGITLTFEASVDGGTTYATCLVQRMDGTGASAITSTSLTANQTRFYAGPIPPGATHVRMRVSAWASPSGTVNARIAQRVMPVAPYVSVQQSATAPIQTQVGDGSNQATVIPRGTAEASTDKGISVVPLAPKLPTYQVVTTEITSATATGVKENLTLWHASTVTKDVFITEIGVNTRVVQTAGTFAWELQFISAENGTPGGTTITAQPLNLGDAASGLTIRQVVTGAPVVTGQIFQHAAFPLPAAASPFDGSSSEATILFRAESPSEAIVLRNGQNEGLRITQNIAATLTTAPIFTIYVRYIERA